MQPLEERVKGLTTLSADEIMAVQWLVKDAAHAEIAKRLNVTEFKVSQLESAIHVKLGIYGIPSIDARRWFTKEAYNEYFKRVNTGQRVAYNKPAQRVAHTFEPTTQSASRQNAIDFVVRRIRGLSPELRAIAEYIGAGLDNFQLAIRLETDVNNAGQLVARLYGALGLPKKLKKQRRTAVREAVEVINRTSHAAQMPVTMQPKEAPVETTTAVPKTLIGASQEATVDERPTMPNVSEIDIRVLAESILKLGEHKLKRLEAMSAHDFQEQARPQVAQELGLADATLKSYLSTIHAELGFPMQMPQARRAVLLSLAWKLSADERNGRKQSGGNSAQISSGESRAATTVASTGDDIERLADGIASLSSKARVMVEAVVRAGYRNGEVAAAQLGITSTYLSNCMGEVYDQLGLPASVGRKERQRILGVAFGRYKGRLAHAEVEATTQTGESASKEPNVPAESLPPVEEQPTRTFEAPAVINTVEAPQSKPEESVSKAPEPTVIASVRFAPPVVIPLSDNDSICGVHVVTRFINSHGNTDVFEEDIERLRKLGLRPEHLTTVPTEDGTGSIVQLHFVKRAR